MADSTLMMTMLLDFYGSLLSDKQEEYLDLYLNEDLSLSEIAERSGITRQGVHNVIKSAVKSLEGIEHKTGIVEKWLNTKRTLDRASEVAKDLLDNLETEGRFSEQARELVELLVACTA